jgi:hypothetical protein
MKPGPRAGFEFVAFGDQRALLRDDWPALIGVIDTLASRHDRLLFLVDTGDIVDDGTFSDQFRVLAGLLGRVRRLPYLAARGQSRGEREPARSGAVEHRGVFRLDRRADLAGGGRRTCEGTSRRGFTRRGGAVSASGTSRKNRS